MSNIPERLFGTMNYNLYTNLQLGSLAIIGGSQALNYIDLIHKAIDSNHSTLFSLKSIILPAIIGTTFLYMSIHYNGKQYTKDFANLQQLYNEFVSRYIQLNRIMEITNPYSIYTMFCLLLNHGYLSEGKQFIFSEENVIDIAELLGINILCGRGVCRHISRVLRDVFINSGNDASILGVCYESDRENHDITVFKDDSRWIYFDPTQNRIYHQSHDNPAVLYDNRGKVIIPENNLQKIRPDIPLPSPILSLGDMQLAASEIICAEDLFRNNLDIFEEFYKNNKDLYAETSEKVMKFAPKKHPISRIIH